MIKKNILRGLKVTGPLLITFLLIVWAAQAIESIFSGLLQPIIPGYFPGLGALIGILFVFIVGVFINAWIVRSIWHSLEKAVEKIPIVNTVYTSIQDSMKLFSTNKGSVGTPVMVDIEGYKLIGFLTAENLSNLPTKKGDVAVYLPMSYQIGGYLVILPKSKIVELEWTTPEAMKYVLCAGIVPQTEKSK